MNKTNVLVAIGVVLALTLSLVSLVRPATVLETIREIGAVSGPDSSFDCESHNSVTRCFTQRALTLATTTPCAIKSPSATSTLVMASLRVNVASSTATIWDVTKASTAFATTTALNGQKPLASGVQGTLSATTTQTVSSDDAMVFAPNKFLVWGARGFIPAGVFLAGTCNATFEVI